MKNMRQPFLQVLILLCGTFVYTNINAQNNENSKSQIKELKIGDQCPDFQFGNIINYTSELAKLSDFKGKLVILDFWATWCGPCVYEFPKLDSLQKKFKKNIVILQVTDEPTDKVQFFLKKNYKTRNTNIPSVTLDTILRVYFPHHNIPHEVWIDEHGKLLATTLGEDVNENTISKYLTTGKLDVQLKKDNMVNLLDPEVMKLSLLNGGLGKDSSFDMSRLKYQSVLTDYMPGVGSILNPGSEEIEGLIQVKGVNVNIGFLYSLATQCMSPRPNMQYPENPNAEFSVPARTILEVRDSSRFIYPGSKNILPGYWMQNGRRFCYQLFVPKADSSNLRRIVYEDLNRYFGRLYGIIGHIEKRKVMCYALVRTTEEDHIHTKGEEKKLSLGPNEDDVDIKNYTLDYLMAYIYKNCSQLRYPIVNETDYKFPVDLRFKGRLSDPDDMNRGLKRYGLEFKFVERELDMIIIRDIKKSE